MRRYEGRVALVTGAAQGLGLAMASRFAAEGADVALCDVSADAVAEAADGITPASGQKALPFVVDVSDSGQVNRWVEDVRVALGRVDVLVNNAGIVRDARVERMTDDEWEAVVAVSLRGMFNCVRAVFPAMKEAGYGRIVSMASMSWRGNFGQANYSAAKAGIVGMARTVALEGAPHGITSNVIAPGPIDTPMLASMKDDIREMMVGRIPVRRLGRPEDIAETASFLCSEAAGFVTGVVVDVDGGLGIGVSLR